MRCARFWRIWLFLTYISTSLFHFPSSASSTAREHAGNFSDVRLDERFARVWGTNGPNFSESRGISSIRIINYIYACIYLHMKESHTLFYLIRYLNEPIFSTYRMSRGACITDCPSRSCCEYIPPISPALGGLSAAAWSPSSAAFWLLCSFWLRRELCGKIVVRGAEGGGIPSAVPKTYEITSDEQCKQDNLAKCVLSAVTFHGVGRVARSAITFAVVASRGWDFDVCRLKCCRAQ
jgi:hypothetical protein